MDDRSKDWSDQSIDIGTRFVEYEFRAGAIADNSTHLYFRQLVIQQVLSQFGINRASAKPLELHPSPVLDLLNRRY